MAITTFAQWSATAALNIDLNSIPLDSAVMTASQVDDAFREMMSQLKVGVQPLDSDLTSWAAITRASGFDTFVASPSSANLAALLTDESGSSLVAFQSFVTETAISQGAGISSGGGSITSASGDRSYTRTGRQVTATWTVTISNVGSATSSLVLTLPIQAAASGGPWVGVGVLSNDLAAVGKILEGGTTVTIKEINGGADMLVNGITTIFTITYWV